MSYKRLGKAIAIVLAAALVMQTTVAYAAEDDCIIEELLVDDDFLVIEDVDDSEDIEDITENDEDEVPYEESEVEDFSDDSMPDDGLNIEFDEEENSDLELDEVEEGFLDEEGDKEEAEEIALVSEEDNTEDTAIEADVSGNDVLDTDVERNNVNASSKNPVKKVEIFCGLERTEANISHYMIKYNKNGDLKSAALILGTGYTSMELKAVQTRKDGTKAKDVPRWESKKNSIVTVSGSGSSITIKAVSKGKTKIVCYAGDGSGKKKEVEIEVRQAVKELEIKGQDYIAKGAKTKLKTVAYPKNANNKKVTWELDKQYPGVSIDGKNGKVKVEKDAKVKTITVIAKAIDQGGASARKTFKIKAENVTIKTPATQTIATHAIGDLKTSVTLDAYTDNEEIVSWKISDPKKAGISVKGNKATVTAIAPGKVTVTAYANDGSGKKDTVKLNVIIPASGLELCAPKNRMDNWLALGCNLKLTPVVGNAYGKPSNTKVEWEYEFIGYDEKQEKKTELSDAVQNKIKENKYFYKFKKGKITAVRQDDYNEQAKLLQKETGAYNYEIVVTARTTDGSNISVKKLIKHVEKNKEIHINSNKVEVSLGGRNNNTICLDAEHDFKQICIKNSNPEVADVKIDAAKCVWINGRSKGTTKVTFTTMDGTGLRTTLTIIVN